MRIQVPADSNSSTTEESVHSFEEEFFEASEYIPHPYPKMSSHNDINMRESSLSTEQIEKLSRLANALANAPPEISSYLNDMMEGRQTTVPIHSRPTPSIDVSTEAQIQRDASFGKWDGQPHTWTPHYQLLQVQCEVYLPFLVTQKAVCMKIYESIPEPQRQRIRGYWIGCGRNQFYNWKEFLEECDKTYFNRVGAEKAEQKLFSMKQGESQFFRNFLEDWELQLEYAGGSDWPQSFKIKQLHRSLSEKLSDKIVSLKLSKTNYSEWVEDVAEVASNIEIRQNFIRRGESQVTQHVTQHVTQNAVQNSVRSTYIQTPQPSASVSVDHDGDVIMGGMKLGIKLLADMIATLNTEGKKKEKKNIRQKTPAPWRTEQEVSILRSKKLCLRCEKPGHMSRFCKYFGPPKRPDQILNIQNSDYLADEESEAESGKD